MNKKRWATILGITLLAVWFNGNSIIETIDQYQNVQIDGIVLPVALGLVFLGIYLLIYKQSSLKNLVKSIVFLFLTIAVPVSVMCLIDYLPIEQQQWWNSLFMGVGLFLALKTFRTT